jgi:hypothetical protein
MCPNLKCRRVLAVPATARGKTVRCRGCGATVRIPAEASKTPPNQPEQGTAVPPDKNQAKPEQAEQTGQQPQSASKS